MIVRPATLADLNACLLVDHDCVTHHVWQMKFDEEDTHVDVAFRTVRLPRKMRADYPRSLDRLVEDWQRGEGFLVAEVDGEIRGYVDLVTPQWQRAGWLLNMAVDTAYRRRGIGTSLVRHARQWAWDRDLRTLFAETTTKNYPALSFFKKLGFQFCGFNDHYYENQDIALFFMQPLR